MRMYSYSIICILVRMSDAIGGASSGIFLNLLIMTVYFVDSWKHSWIANKRGSQIPILRSQSWYYLIQSMPDL